MTSPSRPLDELLTRAEDAATRGDNERFELLDELRAHPALRADDAASTGDAGGGLDPTSALRAARLLAEHGEPQDLGLAGDLAWRSHQGGQAAAGPLFATCADRIALYQGRPQRFGTVVQSHQGEAILAPIDRSVPDEIRAQLGVPPVSELRAEVEQLNRRAARQRAQDGGGLPEGSAFARVWHDPSAAELRRRREAEGQPVWLDENEELTFVCDRPLAGAIVGPVFEIPMWRVADDTEGSAGRGSERDLLVLSVRARRASEAVLTYGFWPLDADGRPAFSRRPEPDGRFRGPEAPAPAPTNEQLRGSLIEHAVESRALGEPRRVAIYLPPGHARTERLPVVYATDGGMFAPYARRVDAAIEAGTIPRVVVVAAHSAGWDPSQGGNLRGMEYLFGFDPGRYDRHERFFVNELPAWAEEELGVSDERDQRIVFGCSDGGAHALAVGVAHPDRFGHVIAYSSGMPPQGRERWADGMAPYIQLCAGIYESGFFGATQAWDHWLSLCKLPHHWTERVCGHEPIQWVEELPAALGRALG